MRHRILGRTGLSVSDVGFGAWGIGGNQWQGVSTKECENALLRALELGVNFFDTGAAYGDGFSERLVGKALKRGRSPAIVATKVPPMNRVWPAQDSTPIAAVFPWRHIVQSTERSLQNLDTDTIDLQQLHVWNAAWTGEEEWRRAFEDLKGSGKIRFVGVSLTEHDPDSGIELVKSGLVDVVQVLYNIFDPSAAANLFSQAVANRVGIIARVPLDEGGLSGSISERTHFAADDFRAGYFRGERRKQLVKRVSALRDDLRDGYDNLPETAIRFCLSNPAVTTVIPGMRHVKHVESNVHASDLGALSGTTLALLRRHEWPRNFYI